MYLKTFLNGTNGNLQEKSHGEMMLETWYERKWAPELRLLANKEAKQLHQLPSFTIVRNPLHRLVSAWREKLGPLSDGDVLAEKVYFFVGFVVFVKTKWVYKLENQCSKSLERRLSIKYV